MDLEHPSSPEGVDENDEMVDLLTQSTCCNP